MEWEWSIINYCWIARQFSMVEGNLRIKKNISPLKSGSLSQIIAVQKYVSIQETTTQFHRCEGNLFVSSFQSSFAIEKFLISSGWRVHNSKNGNYFSQNRPFWTRLNFSKCIGPNAPELFGNLFFLKISLEQTPSEDKSFYYFLKLETFNLISRIRWWKTLFQSLWFSWFQKPSFAVLPSKLLESRGVPCQNSISVVHFFRLIIHSSTLPLASFSWRPWAFQSTSIEEWVMTSTGIKWRLFKNDSCEAILKKITFRNFN